MVILQQSEERRGRIEEIIWIFGDIIVKCVILQNYVSEKKII